MATSPLLERAVSLLRGVYGASDNDARRASTEQLLQLEHMLSSAQARDVGLDLLRVTAHGAAVQAYGAVLLRHAVRDGRLRVRELPVEELLSWYVSEPTLGRLLLGDLVELLVECAIHADDDEDNNNNSNGNGGALSFVPRTLRMLCATLTTTTTDATTTAAAAAQPRPLALLHAMVASLLEPDFARVPRERAAVLRQYALRDAEAVLRQTTQALFACYVQSGGAAATHYAPGTEDCVEACVGVLATMAPHVSVRVWAAVALPDTMAGLLQWQPARRRALALTASLLRCSNNSNDDNRRGAGGGVAATTTSTTHAAAAASPREAVQQQLLSLVLDSVPACVAAFHSCNSGSGGGLDDADGANARLCELGVLEEVLELLSELPRPLLLQPAAGRAACTALLPVLSIPSLQCANVVCGVWLCLDASVWSAYADDVCAVYAALRCFVPKQQLHPVCGTHALGRWLSEQQLGFVGMYDATFADYRKNAGALLERLARLHAERTGVYIAEALLEGGLCSGDGSGDDPRTPRGYVTQASATYRTWEAIEYMLSHLAEAFRTQVTAVPRCMAALLARQPRDAVLLPTYLNMLASFWRCRDDAAVAVWETTVQILLAYIDPGTHTDDTDKRNNSNNNNNTRQAPSLAASSQPSSLLLRSAASGGMHDPDEAAARRRVHTLLVTLGVEHAHRLGVPLVQRLLERLYALLLHSSGAERALLCEAMASLTTALPRDDAEARLRTLLQPLLDLLQQLLSTEAREQHAFDRLLLLPSNAHARDVRDTLRDAVTAIAAVLRRCHVSGYVMEAALRVVDVAARIAELLHGIDVSALPPYMAHVLDMEDDQRAQYLPGQSRPSIIAMHNSQGGGAGSATAAVAAVRAARMAVLSLRLAVYQIFGALSPMLPAAKFAAVLQSVRHTRALPLHALRALTLHCLLPIAEQHTTLLAEVLDLLDGFFAARARAVCHGNSSHASITAAHHGGGGTSSRVYARGAREQDEVIEAKQWMYYTKDVRAFVQRSVLDAQRWRTQPGVLAATARLGKDMLDCGADTRAVLHMLLALVELRVDEAAAAVVTRSGGVDDGGVVVTVVDAGSVADVQASVFACLVHYVVYTPDAALPPRERDSVAYALSEPYLRRFPTLASALQTGANSGTAVSAAAATTGGGGGNVAAVSQAQLDMLHAQLTLANRHGVQRRYVKDFLLALAQKQQQQQQRQV